MKPIKVHTDCKTQKHVQFVEHVGLLEDTVRFYLVQQKSNVMQFVQSTQRHFHIDHRHEDSVFSARQKRGTHKQVTGLNRTPT